MTENVAKTLIEWFKVRKGKTLKLNDKGIDYVVQALEEVQEYRKIGLTPELIEAMQGHNIALINDLGEYQQIGTIEDFKALKEKNTPKKIAYQGGHEKCPSCGSFHVFGNYCTECGQAVDYD